jgi:hypothetical protein
MCREQLYEESADAGNNFRCTYLEQVNKLIETRRIEGVERRREFFTPDYSSTEAYEASTKLLRDEFRAMLGFPLIDAPEVNRVPRVEEQFVAADSLGSIGRLQIEVLAGFQVYGLLFLPPEKKPHSLVVSCHGGMGTPELTTGFFGSANYNDMTRRLLRRGFAVFAPQFLLWEKKFGPDFDRIHIDRQLKQLGGSIAALELFGLQRSLDYLLSRADIRSEGAGVCGLSYGGFYALFAAANDPRLIATVSSCFVNDRWTYDWPDWVWQNSANRFTDVEVAGLICPRALFVEIGEDDELFSADKARAVLTDISVFYQKTQRSQYFQTRIFDGGHEFSKTDESLDFLVLHLEP